MVYKQSRKQNIANFRHLEPPNTYERRRVHGSLCFQYQDEEAKVIRRIHRELAKTQRHLEKEAGVVLGESWRIQRLVETMRSLKRDSFAVDGEKAHECSDMDASDGQFHLNYVFCRTDYANSANNQMKRSRNRDCRSLRTTALL